MKNGHKKNPLIMRLSRLTIRNRAAVGEKRSQKKSAYHAAFKAFFVHKKFTFFFLRKVPPQLAKSSPPISEKFPPCVLIMVIF